MHTISTTRDRWVWVIAGALMAGTLGMELVTPLGYAVWLTYFVAVGVTVFQNRPQVPLIVGVLSCVLLAIGFQLAPPSTNSSFSSVNRSIGGVSFLAMALVVMQAIRARRQAEFALWLQQAENTVEASLRGDQAPQELADAAVRALCQTLDAQVGALYRIEGDRLRL
ncbi:histidine kinase, partial [Xanthomonas perforans]